MASAKSIVSASASTRPRSQWLTTRLSVVPRGAVDGAEEPVVDDELEPRARARLAEAQRLGADRVEDRRAAVERFVGPAGQHDERALLGGLLGAQDGRVDERDFARRALVGDVLDAGDADGARLAQDRAVAT